MFKHFDNDSVIVFCQSEILKTMVKLFATSCQTRDTTVLGNIVKLLPHTRRLPVGT